MKFYMIFTAVFLSSSAFAQKAQLTIVDPDIDQSQLTNDFQVNYPAQQQNFLPDREERDSLYKGIAAISKWDELKKDVFFLELKSLKLKELHLRYPELSEADLKQLKSRIKR